MRVGEPDRSDARTGNARRLRRTATSAERTMWRLLARLELPFGHFRRQAPIGPYFADFAHHGLRLIVELDGGGHGTARGRAHDERRTAYLRRAGYRVLRFWNADVHSNPEGVTATISEAVAAAEAARRFEIHTDPCEDPIP